MAMQVMWQLQVDVFGEDSPYPILRHVFFGESKDELDEDFKAHIQNDKFLRESVQHKSFRGIPVRWEAKYKQVALPSSQR